MTLLPPRLRPLAASLPLAVLSLLVLSACERDPQGPGMTMGPGADRPPTPVTYATVEIGDSRVDAEYAGRLHGVREAQVRARIGGILEERLYEEGEVVDQGTALFRIEQAPYRIALQRAEAERANAQAALRQAEREWRRVSGLYEQAAISQRERDRALSELELGQARLGLAAAGVAEARLNLDYTVVNAPVDGVTGLEALTAGNLVEAGTLLTTVTQLDPVQLRFAMPERDAAARRVLAAAASADTLEVVLLFSDGSPYPHAGTLDFTASTVDARTGAVTARATFPNPDLRLRPGMLARVRLAIDRLEDVSSIDATAVSQGRVGPIVFVVDDENVARAREVRLGPVANGRQVVLEGLAAGDRVVVNGQVALRDGARVNPQARDGRSE